MECGDTARGGAERGEGGEEKPSGEAEEIGTLGEGSEEEGKLGTPMKPHWNLESGDRVVLVM